MSIILKLAVKGNAPVLRGEDHYWSVMMDFAMDNRPFSVPDVSGLSNAHPRDIRNFVRRLFRAGFIEQLDEHRYRVVRLQSARPRVRPDGTVIDGVTANQAMWNAMRSPVCRQGFTFRDLVQYASTDSVQITQEGARGYIKKLASAGYLVVRQEAKQGKPKIWALLPTMNTGPAAPKVLRSQMIFDPNKQAVIGDVIAEEEA